VETLVRRFAEVVSPDEKEFDGLEVDVEKVAPLQRPKPLLQWKWVEACVAAGRLLGPRENFGGYAVK
jgi:hypothetical protein